MTPSNAQNDLTTTLQHHARMLEAYLAGHFETMNAPQRLRAAIKHGSLGAGKRLRPFLVAQSAALFGVAARACLPAGAALECVHCYSLLHDDLPDMDNDRLRRGKPTVWAAFDPATAILAGDALLTEAFALLAAPATHADPAIRAELVAILARAAGARGMVGGQMRDIEGETRALGEDEILAMQAQKTGALITAAAEMGAVLGGADATARATLHAYGQAAGRAFQLADDILDVTASSDALGKTAGKDVDQNKSTIVARRGVEGAQALVSETIAEGEAALTGFDADTTMLRALLRYLAERRS